MPEVVKFAKVWCPTMLAEQYEFFQRLQQETFVAGDSVDYDYLRAMGLLGCGNKNGEVVWYLPQEIGSLLVTGEQEFRTQATHNTELGRLATGILYYYGYLDFSDLFSLVCAQLPGTPEDTITHFVGVLMNLSAWQDVLVLDDDGASYYLLDNPEQLAWELSQREHITPVQLTREQVLLAGDPDYVIQSPQAQALRSGLSQHDFDDQDMLDDFLIDLYASLQNGDTLTRILERYNHDDARWQLPPERWQAILPALVAYNNGLPMWMLKGHTPDQLSQAEAQEGQGKVIPFDVYMQKKQKKVGRNDPCPCGSGKKYKNCCLRKDEL